MNTKPSGNKRADRCVVCDRIQMIAENRNPYFVAELDTGYAVIGDFQYFRGYSLFLCKKHVPELHLLPGDFKRDFLVEMSLVGEAVIKSFRPVKLNYELLGNTDPHLHWHLFPRHSDDPNLKGPVSEIDREARHAPSTRPDTETLNTLRRDLLAELKNVAGGAYCQGSD